MNDKFKGLSYGEVWDMLDDCKNLDEKIEVYQKMVELSEKFIPADLDDYAKLNPKVETMKSDIVSIIKTYVSSYDNEQLAKPETKKTVKEKILNDIQTLFNSKFIVDITIDYLIS